MKLTTAAVIIDFNSVGRNAPHDCKIIIIKNSESDRFKIRYRNLGGGSDSNDLNGVSVPKYLLYTGKIIFFLCKLERCVAKYVFNLCPFEF